MLVAEGPDERDAVGVGVTERTRHRVDDHVLLGDGLWALRRVLRGTALAVVQPRVDVEGHVDDVEAVVASVGQGVDDRAQEEVAAVLAAADVDERGVGRDAAHADAVEGRTDGAGDVGAVTVVVHVRGVDTPGVLARTVDRLDVGREVAREGTVEVRRDVEVASVDAGVEDPDADLVAGLVAARLEGVDHLVAPQQAVERVGPLGCRRDVLGAPVAAALPEDVLLLDRVRLGLDVGRSAPHGPVSGRSLDPVEAPGAGREGGVTRGDGDEPDVGVGPGDLGPGGGEGGREGVGGDPLLGEDLVGRRRSRR